MKDKYYSKLISEDFHEKISFFRKEKGLSLFKEFAFIFVNSKTYECKHILGKNLCSTEMDNEIFTNIVVLGYSESINQNFLNRHYAFIGIFDMKGNESNIDLGSIALNSIFIGYMNYNTKIIKSCNITIYWEPFEKYINNVLSPVDDAIFSSLKDDYFLGIHSRAIKPYTMNIFLKNDLYIDNGLEWLLKYLKNFEINLSDKVKDFNPEIPLKIKSSEIQF